MTKAALSNRIPEKGEPLLEMDESLEELWSLVSRMKTALKHSGAPSGPLRELFDGCALGPRHMPAIVALVLAGPMSVSELAARLGLSVATTSLMVGELSRAGVVERREDEADRRRTIVSVADAYRDDAVAWIETRRATLRRALERLSPREREAFLTGARVLVEEFEAATPTDSSAAGGQPASGFRA